MDDDEEKHESPPVAKSQGIPDSVELDKSGNGTVAGPLQCIFQDEGLHQHACNKMSCHLAFNPTTDDSNENHFATHHYHYIEYPGMYYQRRKKKSQDDNVSMPHSTNSTTYHYCVCSCSSSDVVGGVGVGSGGGGRIRTSLEPQSQEQPMRHTQEPHESRLAVAAIVHHHQSIDANHQSQQSLLSHSYQMLNSPPDRGTTGSNSHSKLNINCDLEDGTCNSATCSCTESPAQRSSRKCKKLNENLADSVLATADEITVSESDNNGTLTKRRNMRDSRVQKKINSWYAKNYNCNHIEIYSDGDEDNGNHRSNDAVTSHGSLTNILDQRPPLPPRPAPITATQQSINNTLNAHRAGTQSIKKYVIWCLVCGGFSCILGALFLGVYFLLHSYTITVGNFETVPTFVPATLLILTGLCIISLARRKNRYSYLIKLSGACGLISALTCALVTVTTTVLHMSRLQALRECEYAQKTRTCTCYSDMIESQVDRVDKEGVRLVFDSLSDCGVVHGSLYSCLRAIFGLSVAGVLVAVFSCMLVYQLLSHERKKMYWEQLELRCRSLYTSHHHHQPHQVHTSSAHNMAALASIGARSATMCRCCEQCHAHRQLQLQTAAAYPWVDDSGEPRFWAGQPPGNFYSPNPGGEENQLHGHHSSNAGASNRSRISSGWSWPRMPWQRSSAESSNRFRQIPSSPDSQYGFSSTNPSAGMMNVSNVAVTAAASEEDATAAAVAAVAAAATATQRVAQAYNIVTGAGGAAALPYGIWGPPPPYSDPNSPARRGGYYQYMQPTNNLCTTNRVDENIANIVCNENVLQQQRLNDAAAMNSLTLSSNAGNFEQNSQRNCTVEQFQTPYKSTEQSAVVSNEYNNTGNTGASDSDVESVPTRFSDRFSNTLPTRKIKKRVVIDGSSSIAKCVASGGRHQLSAHRINVQRIFPNSAHSTNSSENDGGDGETKGDPNENSNCNARPLSSIRNGKSNIGTNRDSIGHNNRQHHATSMQHCNNDNLEHNACMSNYDGNNVTTGSAAVTVISKNSDAPYEDPTESEIYFADVSSCCNMSMKNDNCYEDTTSRSMRQYRASLKQNQQHFHHSHAHGHNHYQQQPQPQQQHQEQQQQQQRSNCSQNKVACCNSKVAQQGTVSNRQSHMQPRQAEGYPKKPNRIALTTSYGHSDGFNESINASSRAEIKIENGMPKDTSLHSMCSNESEAKTECTDLSPLTPCSNKNISAAILQCGGTINTNSNKTNNYSIKPQTPNTSAAFSDFIASFPYSSSSETKFHEAHRRITKHMHENLVSNAAAAAADDQDAHYDEIISDDKKKAMSMRVPSTMSSSKPHQQQRSNRMPMHTRNVVKSKENLDSVWSASDEGGDVHNRQRL